jgi:hypothetical protein
MLIQHKADSIPVSDAPFLAFGNTIYNARHFRDSQCAGNPKTPNAVDNEELTSGAVQAGDNQRLLNAGQFYGVSQDVIFNLSGSRLGIV